MRQASRRDGQDARQRTKADAFEVPHDEIGKRAVLYPPLVATRRARQFRTEDGAARANDLRVVYAHALRSQSKS